MSRVEERKMILVGWWSRGGVGVEFCFKIKFGYRSEVEGVSFYFLGVIRIIV